MIGDEVPVPASALFHATPFAALHSTGSGAVSVEMPWLPGPRHCGQSAPASSPAKTKL